MRRSGAVHAQTLDHLRKQLREKFPAAHTMRASTVTDPPAPLVPRSPVSFPKGGITEVIPARFKAGLSLLVAAMLEEEPQASSVPELALIDGRDQFDPASFSPDHCARLLWLRCQTPQQSILAADLILRDGNLPRVVLDLLAFSPAELKDIPSSAWQRLKRWIESSAASFVTLSPYPLIPCATLRLSMQSVFTLEHFAQTRSELIQQLKITTLLQRKSAF